MQFGNWVMFVDVVSERSVLCLVLNTVGFHRRPVIQNISCRDG